MYKGIQSRILNTTRFGGNSDLSTTYLGISDRSKNDKIKAEESFLHIRARVHVRKIVRWNRMSNIVRQRS